MRHIESQLWLFHIALLLAVAGKAEAHEPAERYPVVIDTDAGLDDVVTLAMALQSPRVRIAGIVCTDGVLSGHQCGEVVGSMLALFNRADVPLFVSAGTRGGSAPPFRQSAYEAIKSAVTSTTPIKARAFSPMAYRVEGKQKTVVVTLGPLTGLASALKARPSLRKEIARVTVVGGPGVKSWNVRFDPAAWKALVASGLPVDYLVHGRTVRKPGSWSKGSPVPGRPTSPAGRLLARLLRGKTARHYATVLKTLTDELAWLYLTAPALFRRQVMRGGPTAVVRPRGRRVLARMLRLLRDGRQDRRPVVLSERPLPAANLRPDVRKRRAQIVARHGPVEWRAQVQMNELHRHLGAYSIIGVKMGLRAAELLNAPPSSMQVVSFTPKHPPASCLNDGVIVATGATPGRGLFKQGSHQKGPPRVKFTFNGKSITLALKQRYHDEIVKALSFLRHKYTLADSRYWKRVRSKGLEIWERWHRLDLFEEPRPAGERPAQPPAGRGAIRR